MVRIICEGKSDIKNIKSLLKFLTIEYKDRHFIATNGKSFLLNKTIFVYKTLLEHIENGFVEKILFIVDADDYKNDKSLCGIENTISKIIKLQQDLNIKEISDYYIACDPISQKGYFESLLLSTIDENVKRCYEEFRQCSELNSKSVDKNILTELHKLTQPDKPYNFEHPNFILLKEKLKDLFNE